MLTVLTDSMELYQSRVAELRDEHGPYGATEAAVGYHTHLHGIKTDHTLELRYPDRKRIHNLKYFTWIEQLGKSIEELNAQWYDYPAYWDRIHAAVPAIDELIVAFNERVGLSLDELGGGD